MEHKKYNFKNLESKWRVKWQEIDINPYDPQKPKQYVLDMFPYPSGEGLHVGHWRGYVLSDVLSRQKLMQGNYIIHPMGWDAFGLPAENYAIEHGIHPAKALEETIAVFKDQLLDIGAMYDWKRELNTTDPNFYKWTQWIFVQMFKKGLAYEKEMPLNWCPTCKVVLANEEAAGGECERCGGVTSKRNLRQWMLKITEYAQRLLDDLDGLDWPEKVKRMQAEWIGKSYGAKIDFAVNGRDEKITVFTTRPDTICGATFITLAPEHELVQALTTDENREAVEKYVKEAATLSNIDRMAAKEKTGVFTGSVAVNPADGCHMQIWVADYVLADYGTGAIMCVPGHDERDFEFAKKFSLPILQVISPDGSKFDLDEAYTGDGVLVNSDQYNGLTCDEAKEAIGNDLEKAGIGEKTTNYRLRDWVFSRQRYWGEPIPLIHCAKCGVVPVPEADLPVSLPHVESYQPTDTGESPLALIEEWVNVPCPQCGKAAKRETNTMPQWAGSSWYFLRYCDVDNDKELISKEAMEKFLPVDYYVGGIEHAVLHLLYARFYTKFLYDIGVVNFTEPFTRLFNQGMICKDGKKMSKSRGNGVSPDSVVEKYGTDALRMYILFVGPPELDADWQDNGMEGVYRFLNKLWRLVVENADKTIPATAELEKIRHKMIKDITWRVDNLSLNTAVSGFMEYTNKLTDMARNGGIDKETLETAVSMIAPFAPHTAEELWEILGHGNTVFACQWPKYDESKAADDTITMVVQINGKLRGDMQVAADTTKDDALAAAKEAIAAKLEGQQIIKEIFVPGKLVNFVVKPQ
ncbi:MAG: leucine--tRNA ligase [Defluviitaleaceae bacterium]|nr:leucine--tRNA ligase [Defluviitaleaceae bacterium]